MNSQPLVSFSDELFLYSTLGYITNSIEDLKTLEEIVTFSRMRIVCLATNKKAAVIWNDILKYSNLIKYLISSETMLANEKEGVPLGQTLKKWSHLDLSKIQGMDLQKWREGNPQIDETMIPALEMCVLYNRSRQPELWIMRSKNFLINIDLSTQNENILPLSNELSGLSYGCNPSMASSDSWIAICCLREREACEILIFDRITGECLHSISNLGDVLKIECEGDCLYVLCTNHAKQYKFLQFKSCNWRHYKELCFPDEIKVCKFYLFGNDVLFANEKNHLFCLSKEDCFSNKKMPSFTSQEYSKIKICEGGIYALSKADSSEQLLVSKLFIENSVILSTPLQTLNVPSNFFKENEFNISDKIGDFHVQLDKIFITTQANNYRFLCNHRFSCYDLINGQLLKDYPIQSTELFGTRFNHTILAKAGLIQLLFCSCLTIDSCNDMRTIAVINLNYMKA